MPRVRAADYEDKCLDINDYLIRNPVSTFFFAVQGESMQGAEIFVSDFEQAIRDADKGDAVYFDPPYVPRSPTSNFTAYHREPFGLGEQERLAILFDELGRRHVHAVLSNSDTPITQELYKPFHVDKVSMPRAINSRASGRGNVGELLVTFRRPRGVK